MTKKRCISCISFTGIFIIALAAFYVLSETAEAARLGGGKSFGSRPSYQRSAPAPSPSPHLAADEPRPAGIANARRDVRDGALGWRLHLLEYRPST